MVMVMADSRGFDGGELASRSGIVGVDAFSMASAIVWLSASRCAERHSSSRLSGSQRAEMRENELVKRREKFRKRKGNGEKDSGEWPMLLTITLRLLLTAVKNLYATAGARKAETCICLSCNPSIFYLSMLFVVAEYLQMFVLSEKPSASIMRQAPEHLRKSINCSTK